MSDETVVRAASAASPIKNLTVLGSSDVGFCEGDSCVMPTNVAAAPQAAGE